MLYDKRWDKQVEAKPLEEWQRTLLQAADIIEHLGHCKYIEENDKGEHCIAGAIRVSLLHDSNHLDCDGKLTQLLQLFNYLPVPVVPSPDGLDLYRCRAVRWNNAPERTAEEVIAALREAAYAQRT